MKSLSTQLKDGVLATMANLIDERRAEILAANDKDVRENAEIDQVLRDRLLVNSAKVDGMITSIHQVLELDDPIGKDRYSYIADNGLQIINRSAPFGTVLIIYESRPDVTIEAAAIAFKAGNKILLKGGKEAFHSNGVLINCWHDALARHNLNRDYIQFLSLNRQETQTYLSVHKNDIDLVVPRGGEGLIRFVKENAACPVLVSGRGNNFMYIDEHADLDLAEKTISTGKLSKISACNALDKVLVHQNYPYKSELYSRLKKIFSEKNVTIYTDLAWADAEPIIRKELWYEEFLDYKVLISEVSDTSSAIATINEYSGGHSASIITTSSEIAQLFMKEVDAAAVYHNASTRFTDGGQFGLGAELAISTDKLHHRGPLGLEHLVTNKWYVYGNGQVR